MTGRVTHARMPRGAALQSHLPRQRREGACEDGCRAAPCSHRRARRHGQGADRRARSRRACARRWSHAQAAALAEAALADTLNAVAWTPARATRARARRRAGDWLPAGFEVIEQRGDGLAERLANATRDVGEALLFVGMDTPQLTRALLCDALERLAEPGVDAVLGPTTDGGYWTIGLREPDPRVFAAVPMSTAGTGAAQRARLDELGLRTVELAAAARRRHVRGRRRGRRARAVVALRGDVRAAHRLTSRVAVAFQLAVTRTPARGAARRRPPP